MKRVITHGCSFTKYKWSCWPDFLSWFEDTHVQNYGFSASGNETIARGVVNSVMKYKGIHHMYIMWSGSARYEEIRDTEEKLDHELATYSRFDPDFNWCVWLGGHPDKKKHIEYQKHFLNEGHNWLKTLEKILYTQMFLDKKNIPYTMMVYRGHIINHNKNDMSNGEMALYNQINWNKFKFYKENLGLDEYTKECVPEAFIEKKDLHPLPLALYKFLKYIVLQEEQIKNIMYI